MAKAVAARTFGDDYQTRVFWLQACRMFEDRSKVVAVEIEAANIKSLDDVVVYYSGMFEGEDSINADYYQVKFHMASNGAFTWRGMMDPAFINATSVSLLQRIRNAQVQYAPTGTGARFYVYSPWAVHPDDLLAELISMTDGHILWDVLAKGGQKSSMGKIRRAWCNHLSLTSEEELKTILSPLRLQQGPTMDQLGNILNDKLLNAGMRQVPVGTLNHPYENLAKKFVQQGRSRFTRSEIEQICKRENLWVGRLVFAPETRRIGIRSFLRFAEHIEDETDEHLCLLAHFEGRRIKNPEDWHTIVFQKITRFLGESVRPGGQYLLVLPTHGSIAFVAGWVIDPKSGANVALIQSGTNGREIWATGNEGGLQVKNKPFQIESFPINPSGQEVVLAVSITHDIESDVLLYTESNLPNVSRLVHCRLPSLGARAITGSKHAQMLSQQLSTFLKTERTARERAGMLHLFFSAPNGFMFFLGRHGRSFGSCTLYEYEFEKSFPGDYRPSISIPWMDEQGTGSGGIKLEMEV